MLRLAATVPEPNRDVTYVFYEAEEIDDEFNGLGTCSRRATPTCCEADFAILMEPSNAVVEAGCQGTLRVEVPTTGERAHSARSWQGVNAIHRRRRGPRAASTAYDARKPVIDGLEYHEGLNAVFIRGGVAGNVLPDECVVEVNYRFAPDRSEAERRGVRPRVLRGVRRHGHRQRARRAARAGRAGRQGVRRGGRRRGQPEVRLDRRRPLHRPRRARGQLRPGRPDARAQAGGARADRAASSAARPGCARGWEPGRQRRR